MAFCSTSPSQNEEDDSAAYPFGGSPEHHSFINRQNLNVHWFLWSANRESGEKTKGVIVAFHGYESHGRFGWLLRIPPKGSGNGLEKNEILKMEKENEEEGNNGGKIGIDTGSRQHVQECGEEGNASSPCFGDIHYRGSWVEKFNNLGHDFVAVDIQGHGVSDGWRGMKGLVRDFDDYAFDALELVGLLRQRYAVDTPLYMMGVSLGGAIVARALQFPDASKHNITGAVLFGPMLSLGGMTAGLYKYASFVVKGLARMVPGFVVSAHRPNEAYPWMDAYASNDPFTYMGGIRARTLEEFIAGSEKTRQHAIKISEFRTVSKLLIFANKCDAICEVDGAVEFFTSFAKGMEANENYAASNKSRFRLAVINSSVVTEEDSLDAGRFGRIAKFGSPHLEDLDVSHSLMSEPDNSRILEEVVRWIRD